MVLVLQCMKAYAKASGPSSLGGVILLGTDFTAKGSNRVTKHAVGNLLVIDFKLTRVDLCPNLI
jgi:hypothetical protein